MGYTVAVVGATGAVGAQMIKMLEESPLPIDKIRYLASARSAGKVLQFKGQDVTIEETTEDAFEGVDIALFSAGGSTSAKYAPYAVKAGAVVVDNTSYFRQNPDVPLVVPEVNAHALDAHNGIIACPNCSTIQMMVALEPVRQKWGLDRIIVSTYQAVSGAGMGAILETQRELKEVLNDGVNPRDVKAEILPCGGDKKHYPIAFNALAQIDVFTENDYTYEEMKMTNETKKIMEDDSIAVSATCVRIPVLSAHSESVYIETKEVAPIDEVKAAIAKIPIRWSLKMTLQTKSTHKPLMLLDHVIPLSDVSVKTWMLKKVYTCGLFQITSSKVPLELSPNCRNSTRTWTCTPNIRIKI